MQDEVRADARRALADVDVNVGFARAVVDGLVAGELWADRPTAPRAFHARHTCGMSLVWGPDVEAVADEVARRVLGRAATGAGEWLQVDQRWDHLDWDGLLDATPLESATSATSAPSATVRRTRLNFAFDPEAFAAARLDGAAMGAATAQRRARPATAADFAWPGSTVPADFWPSAEAFLVHGGGWVAEADGQAAALCFAAFRTDDEVEVGVETIPAFRRRGHARSACVAMIDDLLAAGLTPVWSCREDNRGSVRLAESLGFSVSRRLPYFQVRPRPR